MTYKILEMRIKFNYHQQDPIITIFLGNSIYNITKIKESVLLKYRITLHYFKALPSFLIINQLFLTRNQVSLSLFHLQKMCLYSNNWTLSLLMIKKIIMMLDLLKAIFKLLNSNNKTSSKLLKQTQKQIWWAKIMTSI